MNDIAQTLTPRERLRGMLNRVPRLIASGSHNQAVDFKNWIVAARKKVSNARTPEHELNTLIRHWESLDKDTPLL